MEQTSTNVNIIADSAEGMTTTINEIADSSSKVNENTENLNQLAQELTEMVGRFKV